MSFVLRPLAFLTVFSVLVLAPKLSEAQTAVLLVASDPAQLEEVQVATVVAADSSFWLRARLKGRSRLAVITARAGVEQDRAGEAWLHALDLATRMRVAPPPGPRVDCGNFGAARLADSGLPEANSLVATQVTGPSSELELRRALADAGLTVELTRLELFTQRALPPFLVSLYEGTPRGDSTPTLRVAAHAQLGELPSIELAGQETVPLTVIALASDAVLPVAAETVDPSEFAVSYRPASASTDYGEARERWARANPSLWLSEAQATSALFGWTALTDNGSLAPAISSYFQAVSAPGASACQAQVRAARARLSRDPADFVCGDARDLAQSLGQLDFAEPRLSRLFGSLGPDGTTFRVAPGPTRNPLLLATDNDAQNCPLLSPVIPSTGTPGQDLPQDPAPVVVSEPGDNPDDSGEPAYHSDGSCNVAVFSETSDSCSSSSTGSDSASRDSCSGDASSSDTTSTDSCSGDSSRDDSAPDSCSGDASSSDSSSKDSCSGQSDSSSDSAGCGKSDYDGDTCSGSSKSSASTSAALKSSALSRASGGPARHRPRPVRLSLLTLLAAALALPLRRRAASR